jgi:histidine triad (HIT) family protein
MSAAADCLFCRIAAKQQKADIVAEDDGLIAFRDINPQAPTHLLIIPTEHVASLDVLSPAHAGMAGRAVSFAARLARTLGLMPEGYRLVMNCGPGAGQTVFHLHLHLLGGRAMRWPPG